MAEIDAVLKKPFAEQVAFFRNKLGNLIPTERYDDLKKEQHDSAFMVAGAQKADLLMDLARSIDKAVSQGTGLNAWRKEFQSAVEKHDWHGWTGEGSKAGRAWRTRVIYQTNMQTSYSAGRHAQLTEGGFDYWVYHHNDSVVNPRKQHLAWDGLTLPTDHPFWQTHYPPNGWGCQCYVTGARSFDAAKHQGGNLDIEPPEKGDTTGIHQGWDYAPGASVGNTVSALAKKLPQLNAEIGARFWANYLQPNRAIINHQWRPFVDAATTNYTKSGNNLFVLGAMDTEVLNVIKARHPQLMPATAEIAMRDAEVARLVRDAKSDQLSVEWLYSLPNKLSSVNAILLDTTDNTPALLYVFSEAEKAKLILKLDYGLKKHGKQNILRSGKFISNAALQSIKGNIKSGEYELIKGSL